MLPGFQRSFSNLNGPEPTYSEICSFAEVSAIRFGIMNGTLELGFASDSSTRPYGDFRGMLKVFSSTAFLSETKGDRTSVLQGKSGSVRVSIGGGRISKKNKIQ